VQALEPDARSLRHAAAHDADGFVAGELERRRLLRYPPFGELVRIVCSSEEPQAQARAAEALVELLRPLEGSVLGPAPLFRLKGRERSQIVVKAGDRGHAVGLVRGAVEAVAPEHGKSGVSFSVDVDPQ
jgi:primosomal protein N' (replication factor Y)